MISLGPYVKFYSLAFNCLSSFSNCLNCLSVLLYWQQATIATIIATIKEIIDTHPNPIAISFAFFAVSLP